MWKFEEKEKGPEVLLSWIRILFSEHPDPETLVREVIQNSLDAKDNSSIQVYFIIGKKSFTEISSYFPNELKERLKKSNSVESDFNWPNEIYFLTIEDFGTTGLDGPTGENGEIPEKGSSNYYDFWWRYGLSGKKETKGGRWGLGKITFPMVSRIKTFFGLTIRRDDNRELLMGEVIFKEPYTYNGRRYQPYGYFCDDNFNPIQNSSTIQHFKNTFLLERTNQNGLSLVIPFISYEEFNLESIKKAVIIHYFYPIGKGTLKVKIKDTVNNNIIEINSNNLKDLASSTSWENTSWEKHNVEKILDFTFECISSQDFINLNLPNPENPDINDINENSFVNKNVEELKKLFNEEKFLAFKIPLRIKKKIPSQTSLSNDRLVMQLAQIEELQPKNTFFSIYLKKDTSLSRPEIFWIRSGIIISGESKRIKNRPVLGMMVAEEENIVSFLGDAEPPAHIEWSENKGSEDFKKKYKNASNILKFIKDSMNKLITILDEPPKDILKDFLKEIFSIPVGDKKNEPPPKPPTNIPRGLPLFNLISLPKEGGFKISLNSENVKEKNITFPFKIIIKVAYRIRRGNPLKNYSPFDFNIKNFRDQNQIVINNGNLIKAEKNEIEVEIEKEDFNLEVKGFDTNRDLYVDISIKKEK